MITLPTSKLEMIIMSSMLKVSWQLAAGTGQGETMFINDMIRVNQSEVTRIGASSIYPPANPYLENTFWRII